MHSQCLPRSSWGCARVQQGYQPQSRRGVSRAARRVGKKSSTGSWRQKLADATGIKYKPGQQEEEAWQDTSGVYDADGNPLSLEDYADVDAAVDNKSEDDDEWSDLDDNEGLVEDQEIFNMDTGWSIEDFVAEAPDVAAGDHKDSAEEEDDEDLGMAANSILRSIPRHVLKALEQQQAEANEVNAESKIGKKKKRSASQASVGSMRIITGSAAGKRLVSPPGEGTRPMMEKVRGAVFNMVASMAGSQPLLPPGTRWLDLFAGTGAVGLEALSRGCQECHFIEMDPAVARDSLARNIAECGLTEQATVHSMRAEDYLKQARAGHQYTEAKAFDFISICPPYEKVSYEELYDLLEGSPLIHDESIVVVEYAKRLSHAIRDTMGALHKIRDKRYGRTFVAVYGPRD
ncbi:hypothetical protein ABBQ38_015190 [Trebouxia sp. C0009 RCD-2024]